jgi:hypothetical protein
MPDKKGHHDPSVCSSNYKGLSKGMETHGAILTCLDLHNNHDIVYELALMDNGSSSENIFRWNLDAALAAKLIDEYPRTKGGGKQKSTGHLV